MNTGRPPGTDSVTLPPLSARAVAVFLIRLALLPIKLPILPLFVATSSFSCAHRQQEPASNAGKFASPEYLCCHDFAPNENAFIEQINEIRPDQVNNKLLSIDLANITGYGAMDFQGRF